MPTLYIETNFLVGVAKGQDPVRRRLTSAPPSFRVAIPSICFMEALSRFEADGKQWRRYQEQFNFVLREAQRDLESLHAASLANHLEESLLEGADLQNDIRERLEKTMLWLAEHAEQIPLEPGLMRNHLEYRLVRGDPTDNLILHTIMHHSRSNRTVPNAFRERECSGFRYCRYKSEIDPLGIRYFRRNRRRPRLAHLTESSYFRPILKGLLLVVVES